MSGCIPITDTRVRILKTIYFDNKKWFIGYPIYFFKVLFGLILNTLISEGKRKRI